MNWNDPAERLKLIERVGPDEYSRLHREHQMQSVVATVNGRDIWPVTSARFGQLFQVDGENAYPTLEAAKTAAASLPVK